jgi:hypothetical protein
MCTFSDPLEMIVFAHSFFHGVVTLKHAKIWFIFELYILVSNIVLSCYPSALEKLRDLQLANFNFYQSCGSIYNTLKQNEE